MFINTMIVLLMLGISHILAKQSTQSTQGAESKIVQVENAIKQNREFEFNINTDENLSSEKRYSVLSKQSYDKKFIYGNRVSGKSGTF